MQAYRLCTFISVSLPHPLSSLARNPEGGQQDPLHQSRLGGLERLVFGAAEDGQARHEVTDQLGETGLRDNSRDESWDSAMRALLLSVDMPVTGCQPEFNHPLTIHTHTNLYLSGVLVVTAIRRDNKRSPHLW